MNIESKIAIRPWTLALMIALSAFVGILLFISPSHRWQPHEVTEAPYGNDFLQEWVGGRMILGGEARDLYDMRTFEARQHDFAYTGMQWSRQSYFPPVYPPPHYLLATALAWLPYRIATIVWSILLAIAMGLGCWMAARFVVRFQEFHGGGLSKKLLERWSWIAIVLFPCTVFCFIVGQKGPIWLLIIAACWGLLRKERMGWAGILFGLLSIKPTLFFLLPLVMLRYGQWRFLLGMTLSVGLLWGGAFLLLPIEVWSGFAEKLAMSGSYAGILGYHLDWSCHLNSLSYIAVGESNVGILKGFLVLPLCLYGLLLVTESRRLDFDHPDTLWNLLVVTFLLSPHAYYYDLAILLVPLLWYAAIEPKRCVAYYLCLVAAVVAAPIVLETIGIPLIPIVLVGTMVEQRLRHLVPKLEAAPGPSIALNIVEK